MLLVLKIILWQIPVARCLYSRVTVQLCTSQIGSRLPFVSPALEYFLTDPDDALNTGGKRPIARYRDRIPTGPRRRGVSPSGASYPGFTLSRHQNALCAMLCEFVDTFLRRVSRRAVVFSLNVRHLKIYIRAHRVS